MRHGMNIDLVVIDDQEIIRAGLTEIFGKSAISVVAEAAQGADVIKTLKKHKPAVVLLDVQIPEMTGFETLKEIKEANPTSRVVMMAAHDNPTYVARAFVWGAADFILKEASRREMIDVVTAAARGNCPRAEGEMHRISNLLCDAQCKQGKLLSSREMQVLRHIALGLSNQEIGRSLSISLQTVKEHALNIVRKIPAKDRTQAAVWAIRKGLV